MADEFAMLDSALEGLEAPRTDLTAAFDELELQSRPVPPPPGEYGAQDEGDLNALLDNVLEQQSKAPLRPRPDLSMHVDKGARQQYAGQQFATYRALDIDDAVAEYDNRPPSHRGAAERTVRAPAAAAVVPPPEPIRAPWGEETLRMPAQGRAVVSAPKAAVAAVAASHPSAIPPVAEEFDLLNPPDEEKQQLKVPALDPHLDALTLNVATLDGQKMSLQVNHTWTIAEVTAMIAQRLVIWQTSFFALSVSEIGGTLADRWLNPQLTVRDEELTSNSQLVFKIKYFKYPKKLRDPNAVYYFYVQVRTAVINGTLDTNVPMGFKLAALQYAIHHQPYRPQGLRVGMLWDRQAETGGPSLPSAHMDAVNQNGFDKGYIERRIFNAYEHIKDVSRQDAIYAYLKTVKDLPLYGSTIFNVTLNGEPRVVGVAEDGILLSTSAQTKLQNFTTVRGVAVAPPKYEFTPYEDIVKIELGKGTVAVTILSDSDSAHHVFQLSHQNAVSLVELMCGYRRMLEAYVRMSPAFVYPVRPSHPHPALYGKPVARKKLVYSTSRSAVFKQRYLALCRERKAEPHMPLVRELDFATDTDTPIEVLSLSGLRWGRLQILLVLDALVAAKTHQFVDNEDFVEDMKLRWLDLSGNNVLEKGFFTDLVPYFQALAKHPYELQGLAMRNCRLDDDAITALK